MRLGFGEILIIFVVILLVFGANKIPQLGDALGKGIRNFRRASREDDSIDVTPATKEQRQLGGVGGRGGQASAAAAEKKA